MAWKQMYANNSHSLTIGDKMYELDTLIKTFRLHHERSVELNKKLIEQFKEDAPGEPIPDPFNDDFSLPLALEAICKEIDKLWIAIGGR
jgi:hypothetical protein